ncbi:MAG: EthD family reductase [bacterium]|nr:EthD family reductase [bacterium]
MFKFMMLFHHPDNLDAFENSYNDLLGLVERMPNVRRRQVIDVFGSPTGKAPYYRILEVYYDDRATMEASLLSKQGQEAGGQIATFPTGSFEMIFADVYEEVGGSTPKP